MVTHTLHFLPQVDYIYAISDGAIVEQGTYADLMSRGEAFSKFISEFGSDELEKEKEEEEEGVEEDAIEAVGEEVDEKKGRDRKVAKAGPGIMQDEERNTGAIEWDVYKAYIDAGKGEVVLPFLFLSLVLMQVATVLSSYWLVWWQER